MASHDNRRQGPNAHELEVRYLAGVLTLGAKELNFAPPPHAIEDGFIRTVLETAIEMRGTGVDVSISSLYEHFGRDAKIFGRLTEIAGEYRTTDSALALRDSIVANYRRRSLRVLAGLVAAAGDNEGVDLEEVAQRVQALKEPTKAPGKTERKITPPDIRAICQAQPGKHLRIPTQCAPLDRFTGGGLQTGRFITIGGAPGARKTSYVLSMVHAIAMASSPRALCVFIAGDEPRDGLLSRIGQMAGMARRSLDDEDLANSVPSWSFVADHMAQIPNLVLFDPDSDNVTVEEVAAWAGAEARAQNLRLVLVIDSLQTAPFTCDANGEREKSTRQLINDRVKALKRIKNRERACVIVISELNRDGYKTGQKADLSSFKESSDIEYGADVAMSVVGIKGEDGQPSTLVEITILKNRLGPNDVSFKLRRTDRCTFETEEQLEVEAANARSIRAEKERQEAAEFDRRAKACAERLLHSLSLVKGQVKTREDLGALVKEQKRVVVRAISTLLADGRIAKDKGGSYRIASGTARAIEQLPTLVGAAGQAPSQPTQDEPPHTDADMPDRGGEEGVDGLDF